MRSRDLVRRVVLLVPALALVPLAGCAGTRPAGAAALGSSHGSATAAPMPHTQATTASQPLPIAIRARGYEDQGAYPQALAEWRRLRPLVPLDGDLELATALDEARSGQLDSAAVRLSQRVLWAAALDTLPVGRFHAYRPGRDSLFLNGTFEGWHWYVWRARAEVAAARGRWEEAVVAARQCVAARPASGREWLLLAVCAGRAGRADEARGAAREAVALDGGLPEAHYLNALWAWKDGHRADAQGGFRAAVSIDSTFQAAAVALVRSRLPGSLPDSLPAHVLAGPRAVGMLTSHLGPKLEDEVVMEQSPILARMVEPGLPDSLKAFLGRKILVWMFVDPEGRVILADLAWYPPGTFPARAVSELLAQLPYWRFMPLRVAAAPRGVWVDVRYAFHR